jgi:serine/threonine protein kinase/Tol biopolymer transport system component
VYEITAQIGRGGMGEVYRASDSRLKRQVAIKILPAALAADRDRLARFQREAEVLASLNHPNIAVIHGLEDGDGTTALVMELVDGENLAQRIARGPIPIDEALPLARQIAAALEAAHEQGIIHRDVKPANVQVRSDGTVKVLDFGLAKALTGSSDSTESRDLASSPTITSPATQAGVILGTAAYMSPEQAKGLVVDRRTDVWAFGAVLYEMLTGRRAFGGDDVADTLARILMKEPDWTALPATVPPTVERVVRRCLQKDRKQRLRDIGDASMALDDARDAAAPQSAAARSPTRWHRLGWGSALLFGVALAALGVVHFNEPPPEARRVHLSVPLSSVATRSTFALSPDGRSVVMAYEGGYGIRSLESGDVRMLPSMASAALIARTPFWSPDSRTLAFFAEGKLKTMAGSGGPPQPLCDGVGGGGGGTWNRTGIIVFANEAGVLLRVPAAGGSCVELTKPDPAMRRTHPVFLPDGEHFLYVVNSGDEDRRGLYVAALEEPQGRRLLADQSSGIFAPNAPGSNHGHLLFVREQALMAVPFDAESQHLSGDPVLVARPVSFTNAGVQIAAFADANGSLMYVANGRPETQLIWVDRAGKEVDRGPMTGQGAGVSLAADGRRMAFGRTDAQVSSSLWVQDLERDQELRVTRPPQSGNAAVLSPDGQRVAFAAGGETPAIHVRSISGASEDVILRGQARPSDWSRDDRWLVYTAADAKTASDIWLFPNPSTSAAGRTPVPWLRTPALETQGQISPDGRWLAYCSDESGRLQVYLRLFNGGSPAPDTKWQVGPGREPRWRADGKELFWVQSGQPVTRLMSAAIGGAPNPIGAPRMLFEFKPNLILPQGNIYSYAPSADGQRFVVNVPSIDVSPSLEFILNWGQTQGRK